MRLSGAAAPTSTDDLTTPRKDRVEHVLGEATGLRVLSAGVVGREQCDPAFERKLGEVAEARLR